MSWLLVCRWALGEQPTTPASRWLLATMGTHWYSTTAPSPTGAMLLSTMAGCTPVPSVEDHAVRSCRCALLQLVGCQNSIQRLQLLQQLLCIIHCCL